MARLKGVFFRFLKRGRAAGELQRRERERKSARLRSFDKMRGAAEAGWLAVGLAHTGKGTMHKRGATFLAPTAFASALCSSTGFRGAAPRWNTTATSREDDSNLNFLSSFLMRALMHMRGSLLGSSSLPRCCCCCCFFNAPRALISRPPIVKTFRQRQDVQRCASTL